MVTLLSFVSVDGRRCRCRFVLLLLLLLVVVVCYVYVVVGGGGLCAFCCYCCMSRLMAFVCGYNVVVGCPM